MNYKVSIELTDIFDDDLCKNGVFHTPISVNIEEYSSDADGKVKTLYREIGDVTWNKTKKNLFLTSGSYEFKMSYPKNTTPPSVLVLKLSVDHDPIFNLYNDISLRLEKLKTFEENKITKETDGVRELESFEKLKKAQEHIRILEVHIKERDAHITELHEYIERNK